MKMASLTANVLVANRKFTLNNNVPMPAVGMGTFRIKSQSDITKVVDKALNAGYRMFDTAAVYGNEQYLRKAFKELLPKYGLEREDIFITTKLAPSDHGGGNITEKAYNMSLERLGMEYIDLYLIHWPGTAKLTTEDKQNAEMRERTWATLADIYKEGRVKAIGVSNYTVRHLRELLACDHGVRPMVNQVEWHPYYYQTDLLQYCQQNEIVLQAYCSLGGTSIKDTSLLKEPIVLKTADRLKVTPSQVLLAWALQHNVAIIPKSTSTEHLKQNIALEFTIPEECMRDLNNLSVVQTKYAWDPNSVY